MPTPTTTRAAGDRSWRDLLGEHFVDLDVSPAAGGPLVGEVCSRAVGSLQLSSVRSVDQLARRTAGLARTDRRHFVQVGIVEQGVARLQQDGRDCRLGPGDYAVYVTDRPFSWELRAAPGSPAWSLLVLTWCRPDPAAPADALTARRLDGRHGLTGVLGRMLTDLVRSDDAGGPDPGDRLAGELLGLVTTAAGGQPTPAATTRSDRDLLAAVRAHVEEHLADPGLDPRSIAAAHFVSVRQLHRLFAGQQDTVARYVRRRRLERAQEELARSGAWELSLTALAHRCGFADPSVFARAFRAAYGVPPSRYRARAPGG
ncbi:helix-turn-helix domain-containing protein [Geodermatophilus sabuli]|uniref:Transcriptional regulator, AraC family n=1 Tax=Geodermatophilus sabuli TaxID=1564158 RepID=A0A285ELW7_9ACTN|nr:helix-turn-helix domain-containing protein [Geodermatophilus sabuli]MBB3085808.1 AraC-like DNA-binding protein [Geodermatophilus sabuli]SNX98981.1 transcriptional regulator, AraC family [Geodermatophilus sabuli]